jgi:acetyltransferase-like isoleucine patch superfamily enzyme
MNIVKPIVLLNDWCKNFLSEMMKCFLRLNGAKIGKNCYVSFSSRIVGSKVVIGDDSIILERVKIKGNEIIIGDSCIISNDCFISGSHNIKIGDKSYLGKKTRIDLSRNVTIGKDVGFGENSIIWTHGYFPPADEGYPVTYAGVEIADSAWVSTGIIVLPGIRVGKKAIIGAGSVVTKDVPDEMVAAGNPAKTLKNISEIKNTRSFMDTMEEIIDGFKPKILVEKKVTGNGIQYRYEKFTIFLNDNFDTITENKFQRATILLSKKIDRKSRILKDVFYFDFENKVRLRTSEKNVLDLDFYLLGFGIRFLKETNG